MAANPDDQVLRELADLEAIRHLAHTYAHNVWSRDVAGVVGVFSHDAHVDLGTMPPADGRAAVTEAYEQVLGGPDVFLPFVHQHLVDLDGDTATGTCYIQVHGTVDGRPVLGGGRYEDSYRRTDGGWKITHRTIDMRPLIPIGPQITETSETSETPETPED